LQICSFLSAKEVFSEGNDVNMWHYIPGQDFMVGIV
jgi:hypothetical protein